MPRVWLFRNLCCSLLLVQACLAGLQIPLLIINLSPYQVSIDMNQNENCMNHDFNPNYLNAYYGSWLSDDLIPYWTTSYISTAMNEYLQLYKGLFKIKDLRTRRLPISGQHIIAPIQVNGSTPFAVFETETIGSGNCFASDSFKRFSITAGDSTTALELRDPAKSAWELIQNPLGRSPFRIIIGSGGAVNAERLVIQGAFVFVTGALAITGIGMLAAAPIIGTYAAVTAAAVGAAGYVSTLAGSLISLAVIGGVTAAVGAGGVAAVQFSDTVSRSGAPQPGAVPLSLVPIDGVYKGIPVDQRNACLLGENVLGQFKCNMASTSIVIQADGTVFALPMPQISRAWYT